MQVDSAGVLHLKKLSKAGITHVHLLPTFQFAAVDDEKENWKYVANLFNTNSIADSKILEKLPPDSAEQQEKITAIQDDDAYNWGYNPVLWGVPKGSYSSDPNGPCRIVEFRKMIQALTHIGLRVVLDVVYNHLHANGPFDKDSVLDKIVPGYYLRRNTDGFIENSTCVNNTASEHYMVERLIVDDLLSWAINYKVDGFRFDLMGHIMKRTMPNGHDHGTKDVEKAMLASAKDHIQCDYNYYKISMVKEWGYSDPVMETLDLDRDQKFSVDQIHVNYVSAHDNETLFDIISLKTPVGISVEDRCRMNHFATSIIAPTQGIPFFHAGDEMLRSKSLDRDSYNSGDWFNRIQPRLADPSFKPQRSHILAAVENFTDVLRIRYSSPLFRLRTANAIQERVRFHNTGPSCVPGFIVMSIEDGNEGIPGLSQLDPVFSYIVVVFNACPTEESFSSPTLRGRTLQLHPIQVSSTDETVKKSSYEASTGCFTVPARTTSVFVEPRKKLYHIIWVILGCLLYCEGNEANSIRIGKDFGV
ncbi:hypothetical protein GOBAR_AA32388 [Gossypium barbadense]|uniref:Alpha-1,6-glucosidases pullulanase-type C-terminal domain-containing protein n=1 Tax=Gossypium barbadense TaxID=3634 RepID=A0A2P5WB45_GOSBA|nr:hypothetical protein GOBAR_AA32388 [Gossypium barbadense]